MADGLAACGDDLVGAGTAIWMASQNWGEGEHEIRARDAVISFEIDVVR